MTTKEKLKREIDRLPDNVIEQVYQFINSVRSKQTAHKRIHTFKLKGQFDEISIREKAYE